MTNKRFAHRTPTWIWLVLLIGASLAIPSASSNDGPESPKGSAANAKGVATAESGKTIELTLYDVPWSSIPLVDLDNGKTYSSPIVMDDAPSPRDVKAIAPERLYHKEGDLVEFITMTSKDRATWITAYGVDLSAEPNSGVPGNIQLVAHELIAVPTSNDVWKESPKAILSQLDSKNLKPRTGVLIDGSHGLPKSFLIKTREGGRGILQIVAFKSSKPSRVLGTPVVAAVIRYKLVENAPGRRTGQTLKRTWLDVAGRPPQGNEIEVAALCFAAANKLKAQGDVVWPLDDSFEGRAALDLCGVLPKSINEHDVRGVWLDVYGLPLTEADKERAAIEWLMLREKVK